MLPSHIITENTRPVNPGRVPEDGGGTNKKRPVLTVEDLICHEIMTADQPT